MSIADELSKLAELHTRGVLSADEFQRAKQRLIEPGVAGPGVVPPASLAAVNALRRSSTDKWVGGVCGGLAVATGLESWVWRLVLALLILFGGVGLLIYLLLWLFVPAE